MSHAEIKIKTLSLTPDYPVSFFRKVEMPKNGPTYTIKDGEIVETKVDKSP